MRLKNRVAMITGAGGPMGQAIALRFAEEGAALVLTDISENRLKQTGEKVASLTEVVAIRSNVLNLSEIQEVVQAGQDRFQSIDILINVVGGVRGAQMNQSIMEMDVDRWDDTWKLNLKGTVNCIKLVANQMMAEKYGKIVNISSIHLAGAKGFSDYGAAKAGVASLTKTAAMELGPYINVNCIAPGVIQTSAVERMDEEDIQAYKNQIILDRLGEPIDIANAALFLSSDESRYVTGQILAVAGGMSPHL
ncbi:SDR family NAD(P)-dependent oxidoreductase [Peribacillus asahii]|uniref:SDR family NAD(P)-dependent oxidoreductase n=1 Tax=Peribacillus asahii TaxID=228899 RepID=UPI0020793D89|nr:SDR family NAD(P)-dependent oxidoreductase [Peribacillus asahii]USK71336.1 SDR family oxidoreductase [Peribacillus asahii]